MATDLKNPAEPPATTVVADIIRDAQELMAQQLAMFRHEVREDFRKTQQALYPMAGGLAAALLGGVLLCVMLVHLLHWANPNLPLWGGYGIVGGLLAAAGAGAFYAGKKRLETVNPLPEKSAEAVKENVQWLSNPK
jgi:hypothetical protein